MNPEVDIFFEKAKTRQEEMKQLREIILDCGLTEELKWKQPCYTFQKNNILIIGAFKEFCVLSFFKGVLLNDAKGILVSPGENSQSTRQFRFTNIEEILEMEPILKTYIFEAIEVEKAGLKVDFKKSTKLIFPEELLHKLANDATFKTAFEALTPGRQRGYNLYFSAPKQSKTRISRIEKYVPRILNGNGINDCVCGFSKRMPNCDGSHKYLQIEKK